MAASRHAGALLGCTDLCCPLSYQPPLEPYSPNPYPNRTTLTLTKAQPHIPKIYTQATTPCTRRSSSITRRRSSSTTRRPSSPTALTLTL